MAKQAVNIGTTANDGTGDPLRTAFDKINDNFDELYQSLGDGSDLSLTIDSDGNVDISADLTVDTNVLHVDSTNNRVGIGTVLPSSKLEVVGGASHGTGFIQTRSGHPSFSLLNGGTNSVYLGIAPDGGSYNTFMQVVEDGTDIDYLRFNTGAGTERLRIDSSGVVQVRNQTPTIQLYNTDAAVTLNQTLGDIDWYQSDPSDQGVGTVAKIRAVNIGSIAGYGELAFHTGSATSIDERLRIDYQGNVGIGETDPQRIIHAKASVPAIRLEDSDVAGLYHEILGTVTGEVQFKVDGGNVGADSDLVFVLDASEKVRILSSGGLTFNGDTATANALDDYEEGTWTPEFADAATGGNTASPDTAQGSYVKIGSSVTIVCQLQNITNAALTGTNTAYVRNLPFTAKNLTGAMKFSATPRINIFSASSNNMQLTMELPDNTGYILFVESLTNSSNSVTATVSQFSGGTDIFFSMTYFAN